MNSIYVCHYSEIGLKGKNRRFFEKILARNIKKALYRNLPQARLKIEQLNKRFILNFEEKVDDAVVQEALNTVFGLANYSKAVVAPKDLSAITATCLSLMADKSGLSFAVRARRSDKEFAMTSPEINRHIGAAIVEKYKNPVNLKYPQTECFIELLKNEAYIFIDKQPGLGGLPVGTAGRTLALLSGGFDSPVAAWYAMKRGANCVFIHFHVYPFTEKKSQEKVKELAKVLNKYQFKAKIYMVPFAETQKAIAQNCPEKYRIVLYRRFMMRVAEALAIKIGAKALISGESLGQVASQTLDNMAVVEDVTRMPVLRPLIGMDKNEIMAVARKIGTYDISVLPHDDACTRFMPKHPVIYSRLAEARSAEEALDVQGLVQKNLDHIEIFEI